MGGCIERFGEEEFGLVTLTNEIHGHLGIYSTLGAKMGLRAKEEFDARGCGGHISVRSYAGLEPPVSCFNDGLQVSTGASLGHGLISVAGEGDVRPEADFRCSSEAFRMRLLPGFESRIREDIKKGVALYGHSEKYWLYVRSLALGYWSGWDRREIFEMIPL